VGVFIALPGGQPFYANPEAVRLLGRGVIPSMSSEKISEVYQINIRDTSDPYPTERLPVVAALNGNASTCDDMDVCHPDGTVLPLQAWGTPVTGPGGAVEHGIVAFVDVSERIRAEEMLASQAADLENASAELEERVRLRTAELLSSNRELEVFSYSVAHDLRAPLRAIHGYSQILLEEHTGQLDEDGQLLLGDIGRYIERMSQLIEGLLALAGVGRRDLEQACIDMTALAESAVAVLRAAQDGRMPKIAVARLPDAIGDPALIGQVWANLISNAVKFCADQPGAEVKVESEITGEEIIYHVRDNGIGFDMAYIGKLFGVFERLHHATEFPGEGIGLAIVARIVDRHGGRVWAEGRVNGGACFSFALPKFPPADEV
jgi:signal transduction histidine kinase